MNSRRRPIFGFDPNKPSDKGLGADGRDESLSPTEVCALVRRRLEGEFPNIRVRGELSNVVVASSGHLYASLKDDRAQMSLVMWRGQRLRLPFAVEDGLEVLVTGKLSLYEPRGAFQFIAATMEMMGAGSLEARFQALKEHYQTLGWFDAEHKRPLPFLPRIIGVVTSASGAAVHDILQTIDRRFPRAHVLLRAVRVQGRGAAEEIAEAIDVLCRDQRCDVMIVGRGGGSLEDLWAFNEEPVVEAIHRATIPVISAVGHETDITLSDLVADYRALTPTAAGEAVVPLLSDLEDALDSLRRRMGRLLDERLNQARSSLASLGRSWALREPVNYLRRVEQRLDEVNRRMTQLLGERLVGARHRLQQCGPSSSEQALRARLVAARERLIHSHDLLHRLVYEKMASRRQKLSASHRLLEGLSPLAVLERGYSLSRRNDGSLIRSAGELQPGDMITTHFARGAVLSEVRKTNVDEQESST